MSRLINIGRDFANLDRAHERAVTQSKEDSMATSRNTSRSGSGSRISSGRGQQGRGSNTKGTATSGRRAGTKSSRSSRNA